MRAGFSVLTQDHLCIFNFLQRASAPSCELVPSGGAELGVLLHGGAQARAALLQMSCGQRRV